MLATTLWHQYRSAKKIEILTETKIDFSEEKCHKEHLEEQFGTSEFQIFWGGTPPDPSALETWLVLFWNLATALLLDFQVQEQRYKNMNTALKTRKQKHYTRS